MIYLKKETEKTELYSSGIIKKVVILSHHRESIPPFLHYIFE
ncbi:hypothetical protein HMPREF9124_1840 [Oribacterium sp. oral taxon 108 str. F0425]|nr:hypothetical protein HMPREF9124_1840 [Oribacterium sp. oral taxon 108 str. F0425]